MQQKIAFLLFLLITLTTGLFAQNNNCDSALFNKGRECLERKSFDSAIAIFNKVLEKCPTFTTAYANRGMCYLYKKEEKNAKLDFERTLAVAKTKYKMAMFIGYTYFRFEKYEDAYEYFNRATTFKAMEAEPYFLMARSLWLARIPVLMEKYKGDYLQDPEYKSHLKKDILVLLDRATRLDSATTYEYFYYKGMFHSNFEDWQEALTCYQRSIDIHPTIAAYKYCAECCRALKQNQKACDYIHQWAGMYSPDEGMDAFQKQDYARKFCTEVGIP